MILLRQRGEHAGEFLRVARSVVRRHADAHEQQLCAGLLRQANHLAEVVARGGERQAAQAVVTPELEHNNARAVQLQGPWQALQAAARGFAADAGVDDLVPVLLSLKSL